MADINGSGNWMTNLQDAWNMITGQPISRPGQVSDAFMNTVTNSRGSMHPGTVGGGKVSRYDPYGQAAVPSASGIYSSGITPNQVVPLSKQRWTPDSFSPKMTAQQRNQVGAYADAALGYTPVPGAQPKSGLSSLLATASVPGIGQYSSLDFGNNPYPLSTATILPEEDPMTIAANQAAAEFVANSGDMNGRAKANAPLGVYGGNNNVQATRKPGYQRGDGLLAFMTQNDKQPIKGIGGLIERLLTPTQRMDVATKMDVPSPAQRYDNANAVARLNAYFAPRTGSAGGYEYRNGQKVGYAPVATPFGSATPTSGAQAYSLSNAASKLNAIANSAEPSKNLARASLAAQWGFD